jgi:hypothetical protein
MKSSAVTELCDEPITENLDDLDKYDENRDRRDHDRRIEALIAIPYGEITEAPAPDDA